MTWIFSAFFLSYTGIWWDSTKPELLLPTSSPLLQVTLHRVYTIIPILRFHHISSSSLVCCCLKLHVDSNASYLRLLVFENTFWNYRLKSKAAIWKNTAFPCGKFENQFHQQSPIGFMNAIGFTTWGYQYVYTMKKDHKLGTHNHLLPFWLTISDQDPIFCLMI